MREDQGWRELSSSRNISWFICAVVLCWHAWRRKDHRNLAQEPSTLNVAVGLSGVPWCAFTSTLDGCHRCNRTETNTCAVQGNDPSRAERVHAHLDMKCLMLKWYKPGREKSKDNNESLPFSLQVTFRAKSDQEFSQGLIARRDRDVSGQRDSKGVVGKGSRSQSRATDPANVKLGLVALRSNLYW